MQAKFSDVIFRFLPGEGLYSNINAYLSACHLVRQRNDGSNLWADTTGSPYFGIKDIDWFFKIKLADQLDPDEWKKCQRWDACVLQAMGMMNGTNAPSGAQIAEYLQYQDAVQVKIEERIKSLRLPDDYIGIHVRRGDKAHETPAGTSGMQAGAAKRHEVEAYIARLLKHLVYHLPPTPSSIPDDWNLFVMTDDYKVIGEFEAFQKEHRIKWNLWTLCKESYDGFSAVSNLNAGYLHPEDELIDLFAEIEIARRAKCFIGTGSSSIWSYIQKTCSNPGNCLKIE